MWFHETQMKIALFQVWVPSRRSSGISASEANSVHTGAPVKGSQWYRGAQTGWGHPHNSKGPQMGWFTAEIQDQEAFSAAFCKIYGLKLSSYVSTTSTLSTQKKNKHWNHEGHKTSSNVDLMCVSVFLPGSSQLLSWTQQNSYPARYIKQRTDRVKRQHSAPRHAAHHNDPQLDQEVFSRFNIWPEVCWEGYGYQCASVSLREIHSRIYWRICISFIFPIVFF